MENHNIYSRDKIDKDGSFSEKSELSRKNILLFG